jgi:hypothetical protein
MDIIIVLVISVIWFLFLFKIINYSSNQITSLGIYHSIDKNDDCETTEQLWLKVIRVAAINVNLSPLFVIAYYYILTSALNSNLTTETVVFSSVFTLITLVILRLSANPSEKHCYPDVIQHITIIDPGKRKKRIYKIVDTYKERILSFYFSFVCATLILASIAFAFSIMTEDLSSIKIIYGFNLTELGYVFILFLIGLILFTAMGEIFRYKLDPIRKFPVISCPESNHSEIKNINGDNKNDESDESTLFSF